MSEKIERVILPFFEKTSEEYFLVYEEYGPPVASRF